ncbi:MAG: hypothetical protein JKY43_11100 [Phycisphaerales bacterium]|nr:hypothetical protein [Phycisphaerales bacterium]
MKNILSLSIIASVALCLGGCSKSADDKYTDDSSTHDTHEHGGDGDDAHEHQESPSDPQSAAAETRGHLHADGSWHDGDHAPNMDTEMAPDMHDEVPLGIIMFGETPAAVAQGHGAVEAAKEGHLVIVIPDTLDVTIVRAWIGTEDRTLSNVGKDESAENGKYDIHSVAPNPLPENAMWWVEIVLSDGTKAVGSIKPSVK